VLVNRLALILPAMLDAGSSEHYDHSGMYRQFGRLDGEATGYRGAASPAVSKTFDESGAYNPPSMATEARQTPTTAYHAHAPELWAT